MFSKVSDNAICCKPSNRSRGACMPEGIDSRLTHRFAPWKGDCVIGLLLAAGGEILQGTLKIAVLPPITD